MSKAATKTAPEHYILVSPSDPVHDSHHDFEVKHPRSASQSFGREQSRRLDYVLTHNGSADGYVPSRTFPCRGTRRLTDRDLEIWTIQCDVCGERWGIPKAKVHTEEAIKLRMSLTQLPMDLSTMKYEKTSGNEAARAVCRVLIERWDAPDSAPKAPTLFGPTGIGKTHLLAQTAYELVRRRLIQVRYWSAPDLLAAARRHMDGPGPGADEFIERQSRMELLAIDDMGAEQQTNWSADVLLRIMDRRERDGLRTMIATNVPPQQWADVFGDRLASRIKGATAVVEMTGDDWRERPAAPAGNVVPLHRPAPPTDPYAKF